MAEEVEVKESFNDNLESGLDRVETFVENNKQPLLIGGGVLLVIIAAIVFMFAKWLPDRNAQAQKAMFNAEFAFAKDSFEIALNGRTVGGAPFLGFAQVAKKYSFTKAANLSKYYAGICCLNLKKYDDAIKYLDDFSTNDPVLGAVKLNATGDAYAEQGKMDDATKYYVKAAEFSDNETYTPLFLFKAAQAFEKQKNLEEAKKYYEKLRDKYPNSDEGRDIEKYLARVTAQ